ncbi:MAG: peptide-methionine (S)-S-oxide reductase MsrA [Planctomycetota bacterium]
MRALAPLLLTSFVWFVGACSGPEQRQPVQPIASGAIGTTEAAAPPASPITAPATKTMPAESPPASPSRELATFGGGCFWCTEAVLEQLDGVLEVTSGYAGGSVENPSYEQVCSGTTGHAEVVQVTFDPTRIPFATLLEWFFNAHDPTTQNQQGPDQGTQYRSAIFFHSEAQKAVALAAIAKAQSKFRDPIVTELTALLKFWPAEPYHQDYFRNNQNKGYCRAVITPKLKKLGLDPQPK